MFKLLDYTEHIFGLLPPGEKVLLSYQGPRELAGVELFLSHAKCGLFSVEVVSSELEYYELDPGIDRFLIHYKMMDHQYLSFFRVLDFRLKSIHKRLNLVYNGGNTIDSRPKLINYTQSRALAASLEENPQDPVKLAAEEGEGSSKTRRNSLLKLANDITNTRSKNLLGKLRQIQMEEQRSRQESSKLTGLEGFKYNPPILNHADMIKFYQKETKKEGDSQTGRSRLSGKYKKHLRTSAGSISVVSEQRQKIEEYYKLLKDGDQMLAGDTDNKQEDNRHPEQEQGDLKTDVNNSIRLEVEGYQAKDILDSKIVRIFPAAHKQQHPSLVHDKVAFDLDSSSRVSDSKTRNFRSSMPTLNGSAKLSKSQNKSVSRLVDMHQQQESLPRKSSATESPKYRVLPSAYLQGQKRTISSKYTSMAVQTVLEGELHAELPQERIQDLFSVAADGSKAKITKSTKDSKSKLYALIGIPDTSNLASREANKYYRKPSAPNLNTGAQNSSVQLTKTPQLDMKKSDSMVSLQLDTSHNHSTTNMQPRASQHKSYFIRDSIAPIRSRVDRGAEQSTHINSLLVTAGIPNRSIAVDGQPKLRKKPQLLLDTKKRIPADSTPFLI